MNNTFSEISKFLIVGLLTVGIDLLIYYSCMSLGIAIPISKGLGFITGTVFAYFANRMWTFSGSQGTWKQIIRFLAVYLTNLGLNVGSHSLLLELFKGSSMQLSLAFLGATGLSAASNFLGMKFLVFKQKRYVN